MNNDIFEKLKAIAVNDIGPRATSSRSLVWTAWTSWTC